MSKRIEKGDLYHADWGSDQDFYIAACHEESSSSTKRTFVASALELRGLLRGKYKIVSAEHTTESELKRKIVDWWQRSTTNRFEFRVQLDDGTIIVPFIERPKATKSGSVATSVTLEQVREEISKFFKELQLEVQEGKVVIVCDSYEGTDANYDTELNCADIVAAAIKKI